MNGNFSQRLGAARSAVSQAMLGYVLSSLWGDKDLVVGLSNEEQDRGGIDFIVEHRWGITLVQLKAHWALGPGKLWLETKAIDGYPGWLDTLTAPNVFVTAFPKWGVAYVMSVTDFSALQEYVRTHKAEFDVKSGPGESELVGIQLEVARYILRGRLFVVNFPKVDDKIIGPMGPFLEAA